MEPRLRGYAFDFDANILFTNSKILLEHKIENEWKIIKVMQNEYHDAIQDTENYRHVNNDIEQSMNNFRIPGEYIKDKIEAIDQSLFGPSWEKFIEATKYANPTAIITARGNPRKEIIEGHKYILTNVLNDSELDFFAQMMKSNLKIKESDTISIIELIDHYIHNNQYIAVSGSEWISENNIENKINIHDRKNKAFEHFIQHLYKIFESYYGKDYVQNNKISVGFSDDSKTNISSMKDFISQYMIVKYPQLKYVVYNTENPNFTEKTVFESK